ncbi:putative transporter YvbV [Paenibacillus sp. J31TS4]|uniref:DMT family transporter n=1 Tax=Paenibacillus sp. J31TS4 TaxID=2807195 RepID=UPI001B12590D|nr:DMT family transporter [Paenibacillus sp. J31TS4]GIP39453.1 putative transporter YvbV [Paenibacillus sp. J31TS4]
MSSLSKPKTIVLLTFLVLVWGLSWPIYKLALPYTPPLLFAGMRTLLGGLLLAAVLLPQRAKIRWRANWRIYVTSGFFNVLVFYGLQTVGLQYMPAGLFSVLVYLQPVLVGLLAWLWLGEAMTVRKVIGLLLGFAGVGVVSAGGFHGHVAAVGIVFALLTAAGWSVGTVYVKRVSGRVDPYWLVALQCILGGAVLTGAGAWTESWSAITWNAPYVAGLLFGIVLGISASWIVYFTLVRAGDASKVASFTFLVPLLSVFSGTLFLQEPFTLYLVFGLVLIAVSIYLVNKAPAGTASIRQPDLRSSAARHG